MADYRVEAINRNIKEVEDKIWLMRQCMDTVDTLLSIRENKTVTDTYNGASLTEFDKHIVGIAHGLSGISYTATYEIDHLIDNVKLSLTDLDIEE